MAKVGMKHPVFAPIEQYNEGEKPTYGTGFVVGGAIKSDLSITYAEGSLYADDVRKEYKKKFVSGALSTEFDEITIQNRATMFGHRITQESGKDVLVMGASDVPVHGGFGYYKTKETGAVPSFEATWYLDTVFTETGESAETQNDSITFQTVEVEGMVFAVSDLGNDDWCETFEASTEAEAKAWLDARANVSSSRMVSSVASYSAPAKTTTTNTDKS